MLKGALVEPNTYTHTQHFSLLIPEEREQTHLQQDEKWHNCAKCSNSKLHLKVIISHQL